MIRDFRHKGLQAYYSHGITTGINAGHTAKIRLILAALHSADKVTDLSAPIFRLHKLTGKQKGRWAMDVSGAWRITFEFSDGEFTGVDYQQYR